MLKFKKLLCATLMISITACIATAQISKKKIETGSRADKKIKGAITSAKYYPAIHKRFDAQKHRVINSNFPAKTAGYPPLPLGSYDIKLNKGLDKVSLEYSDYQTIFETSEIDIITLFNQTYEEIKYHEPERSKSRIENALNSIIENPTGYKVSTGAGTTISKDEKTKGTEYLNDSNISYIECKFSHGITLKTGTKSITTSYHWISELGELFDDARQAVRERNLEIAQIEAKRKKEKTIAEQQALEQWQETKRLAKTEKLERINKVCIGAGYEGYCETIIPTIISTTQEIGGLEEFLNWVVDYPTGEFYTQIKAISILDGAVLYSYSGPDMHFVIHVEKNLGKIYQEGQALEKNFYVFTGMYTYISTTNARKSVPSFKHANIEL